MAIIADEPSLEDPVLQAVQVNPGRPQQLEFDWEAGGGPAPVQLPRKRRRKADPARERVVFTHDVTAPLEFTIHSTGDDPVAWCRRKGRVLMATVPGGRAVANQYRELFADLRIPGTDRHHVTADVCRVLRLVWSTLPLAG